MNIGRHWLKYIYQVIRRNLFSNAIDKLADIDIVRMLILLSDLPDIFEGFIVAMGIRSKTLRRIRKASKGQSDHIADVL